MAEGFAHHFGGKSIQAYSAGSQPAGFVAPLAIQVMLEKGVDISEQYSKGVMELPISSFDYVVTMGCGDNCPWVPAKYRVDWKISDPIGKPLDFFRKVRNEIERKVKELISQIAGLDASKK